MGDDTGSLQGGGSFLSLDRPSVRSFSDDACGTFACTVGFEWRTRRFPFALTSARPPVRPPGNYPSHALAFCFHSATDPCCLLYNIGQTNRPTFTGGFDASSGRTKTLGLLRRFARREIWPHRRCLGENRGADGVGPLKSYALMMAVGGRRGETRCLPASFVRRISFGRGPPRSSCDRLD